MIIPFDKNQQPQGGQQAPGPKPSETDLLLALGSMHNAGLFQTASNEKMPFFDADEIERRGGGTAAETYWYLTTQKGWSKERAKEHIEKGPTDTEAFERMSPEEQKEWLKKEPWKREIEN